MARPPATVLLLLSLLAVAHCRTLESDPTNNEASTAETATVAVADETGAPNPTVVHAEAGATEVAPAERDWFLRLPSHRSHPCHRGLVHRHLWWARHHGVFGDGHRFHRRGDAELVRDREPTRRAEAEEEVKPVAEPDPDRSLPNSDSGDGDDAAVKRWKKELLWRMFRHGHRHHHHQEDHEQEEEGTAGAKRVRRHHRDEEEDDEKDKKMRKLFHHYHHDEDEEKARKPFRPYYADDSDDELEEMVKWFRKAIMRRRFHHGGYFFRHHRHGRHHHHAEEAEEQAHEGGGVVTWIKGLMNRF